MQTVVMSSFQLCEEQQSSRLYECPCGKWYKSYPAIYIHIKNKHQGKAPGTIKKPTSEAKRRGRPPVNRNQSYADYEYSKSVSIIPQESTDSRQVENQTISAEQQYILRLVQCLRKLPNEKYSKKNLGEIDAIVQMNIFLAKKQKSQNRQNIGFVVSDLLQILSKHLNWQKFQQFYLLIIFFLQYIMDELSNTKIAQRSVNILCDYINQFIQHGIEMKIKSMGVQNLSIFKQECVLQIFECVFGWMMARKYTSYRISVNEDFKRVQTKAQF